MEGFRGVLLIMTACVAAIVVGFGLMAAAPHVLPKGPDGALYGLGFGLVAIGMLTGIVAGGVFAVLGVPLAIRDLLRWDRPLRALAMLIFAAFCLVFVIVLTTNPNSW
jgi:hypothetical protein